MQFSEAVTSVTRGYIVPKVYDTITKGSPVLMTLLRNAEDWKSGYRYETIIKYQDSLNGGNSGVADKLDSNRDNVRTKMYFEPKMAYKPIVLADIEAQLNMGDEQVVDLMETEFDSQAQSLMMLMAQNLYTGSGVGTNWDSLNEAADDGTNYANYGTLSRSTYPTIKGYYLANAGATTLAKMATAFDAVTVGTETPDLIVTSKAIWSTFESLLAPTVRMGYQSTGYPGLDEYGVPTSKVQGLGGQGGFTVLYYRGVPVVKDEQCPAGKMYFINKNAFGFKGINLTQPGYSQVNFKQSNDGVPAGVPGRVPSTRGFNFRDMMNPVDQEAKVGYIQYNGNFVANNPRLIGQMTGLS